MATIPVITVGTLILDASPSNPITLAEVVMTLQRSFPEPADGDFTITAELWQTMVALAERELAKVKKCRSTNT